MAALAIAVSAHVPAAFADIYFGSSVSLGVSKSATDVYSLACPIGTVSVSAQVGNLLGGEAEFISVQVMNPNGDALSANSREGVPSPTVRLSGGGAGSYLVTVHKSASAVVEPYDINMDCFDAAGVEFPGTQSTLVQDR
jgi:hypothetical protein